MVQTRYPEPPRLKGGGNILKLGGQIKRMLPQSQQTSSQRTLGCQHTTGCLAYLRGTRTWLARTLASVPPPPLYRQSAVPVSPWPCNTASSQNINPRSSEQSSHKSVLPCPGTRGVVRGDGRGIDRLTQIRGHCPFVCSWATSPVSIGITLRAHLHGCLKVRNLGAEFHVQRTGLGELGL